MGPLFREDDERVKNPLASRKRLVKEPLPGVLAVAGASVLAFTNPNRQETGLSGHPTWILERKESRRSGGCEQGSLTGHLGGFASCLDPVQDCRRPRRDFKVSSTA